VTPNKEKIISDYLEVQKIIRETKTAGYKKIDLAFISDMRYEGPDDLHRDISVFGFRYKKFKVLPLTQLVLETKIRKVIGQLYILGIKSKDVPENKTKAQELFIQATQMAIKKGAKVILLAANTKSIFGRGERGFRKLKQLFPNILFVLGDNLVVHFIMQQVKKSFTNNISPLRAKILIIAPRGLIASNLIAPLKELGIKNITGLVNPKKGKKSIEKIAQKLSIKIVNNFNAISKIDLVLACGSQEWYRLNPEIISNIKKNNKNLIVLDTAEPQNITDKAMKEAGKNIDYIRAGNGSNKNLTYVLGAKASNLLGLPDHVTWGCFSEAMSLTYAIKGNPNILKENWFGVDSKRIREIGSISKILGFKPHQGWCKT